MPCSREEEQKEEQRRNNKSTAEHRTAPHGKEACDPCGAVRPQLTGCDPSDIKFLHSSRHSQRRQEDLSAISIINRGALESSGVRSAYLLAAAWRGVAWSGWTVTKYYSRAAGNAECGPVPLELGLSKSTRARALSVTHLQLLQLVQATGVEHSWIRELENKTSSVEGPPTFRLLLL